MLHYARGGSAGNEEIDIEGFVDVLQQTLEEEIKNSLKGAFTVELMAGQESRFVGNRDALLTAIQNLVNNAIDVTEGEVNIIFRLQVLDEEWVQIEVEDDGPGIPKEMQEQIFEPFYTSRARGTGLGLAVVQAVADAHGGEVWVKSALGEGASFGMRIPAAPPAAVVG